jgi:hypothetical protein
VLADARSEIATHGIKFFLAAVGAILLGLGGLMADAADAPAIRVKVSGKLAAPAGAKLGVIATDPVLQQILSEDLQVEGRLADTSAASALTLTATLSKRVLEPGIDLNEIARGDPDALALMRTAGITPPPLPETESAPDSAATGTAAQGNSRVPDDVRSYQAEGRDMAVPPQQPGAVGPPFNPFPMSPWPVPPATAQGRSVISPYPRRYVPDRSTPSEEKGLSAVYDTVFVARATVGSSGGALIVVAVAHPGYDSHEVRKLVAEEIANAVLH